MKAPLIETARRVVPKIYAYSRQDAAELQGWTKIGYTERDVLKRIQEQTHTALIRWKLEWQGNATYEDGNGGTFRDTDFHAYLRRLHIEQKKGTEWFRISGEESKHKFYEFRETHGILMPDIQSVSYELRAEQEAAVSMTLRYFENREHGEFLWNAKPRFGKTLAAYDLAKHLKARTVLVLTNRPAIANSWFDDYARFLGTESGYYFVSEVDALKNHCGVYSREEFRNQPDDDLRCIEFVSLQDLKGSSYFGGTFDKLKEVRDLTWDLLVIDEAHEGVDTDKTQFAFGMIKRKHTLHLSGTPFRALARDQFDDDAIFNWTYTDEQQAKLNWDQETHEATKENPYAILPRLNLYTYRMSDMIREQLKKGIDIDDRQEAYAFDLNEFFATTEKGKLKHEPSVIKFLDALTRQEKYPFSTPELREELKHSFWLLDRVDSVKALAELLSEHPVFSKYHIICAVGDGRTDEDTPARKAFDQVKSGIETYDKTITLSVGQLTTGVTIPEWSAVLMLCNIGSPALYMQAAFRAQTPCLFRVGTEFRRKENAYIFDFNPMRTLDLYEKMANGLSRDTASGSNQTETGKNRVRELLNFFPVIGEDEEGRLTQLNAEQVLILPAKIRSMEVVRRGFMCNFLFSNISNIFGAPQEVIDTVLGFRPVNEPIPKKDRLPLTENTASRLGIDPQGNIQVPEAFVDQTAKELFGDKIFRTEQLLDSLPSETLFAKGQDTREKAQETLVQAITQNIGKNIIDPIVTHFDKPGQKKVLQKEVERKTRSIVRQIDQERRRQEIDLASERATQMRERIDTGKTPEEIEQLYARKIEEIRVKALEQLNKDLSRYTQDSAREIIAKAETLKRDQEKTQVEENIRAHLRGFARTIPSFLMAYGDREVTLDNFDRIIPDNVFREVTGISLDEFRFLRDGGDYKTELGETKHFAGNLFNPLVFDDSVKEFMALKKRLSNYVDDRSEEDIFDYIPPQKTNQIFTPKPVVELMIRKLEELNPGCFDRPDTTFLDPYMKSGLYLAQIVKKLYRSEHMKTLFPNAADRLRHIFAHQIFGLAPTEIIHRIVLSYLLGFDTNTHIPTHHIICYDATADAQNGTLETALDSLSPSLLK